MLATITDARNITFLTNEYDANGRDAHAADRPARLDTGAGRRQGDGPDEPHLELREGWRRQVAASPFLADIELS